jgi:hypothetical protein
LMLRTSIMGIAILNRNFWFKSSLNSKIKTT